MKPLLFCICFFILSTYVHPQNYYYHAVNYNNGLSHLDVKSIYQDSDGFMWFGTKNKLNRFDGVTMRTFDCYDLVAEKRNNNINSIMEAADRKLWLATDNGVFIFNPIDESFHFFDVMTKEDVKATQWVADIKKDGKGNIWIVVPNQGVFKYSTNEELLKVYQVVDNFVMGVNNPESITIDPLNRVWIGSSGSGVYLYNDNSDSFQQFLGNENSNESLLNKNIYTIHHYKQYLIAGIHEEHLMILDTKLNTVKSLHIPQIDNTIIRHIVIYDSILWVATQNGTYSIELENGNLKKETLSTYILSDKYIEHIYRDNEGGVWIGTRFGGVNLLPNHGNIFESYIAQPMGLEYSSNRLKEMVEDDNGNIWIGTEDGGLLKFDPNNNTFVNIKNPKNHKLILALLYKDSHLWMGSFKGGLDIINIKNNSIKNYDVLKLGMNEETLYAMMEDSDGNTWVGNAWGVYLLEKGTFKFKRLEIFGNAFIHDILEDKEGYIWVVTMGSGIYKYDKRTKTVRQFTANSREGLSTNAISSVTEDHKGQLWFSTDRSGVCRYNKQEDRFHSYSIAEGLPDDITYKVLEDEDYNLWFGTNNGLVRLNPETNEIKVYTEGDGLPTNRFNYKSGLVSKSGKLYIGSMEGLIAFEPQKFKTNIFAPAVHIVQLSIFDKAMIPSSKDLPIDKSIQNTSEIQLSHTQSNINISFASLSFTSPTSNSYIYRMEGVDKEWISTKNNNASYSHLQPGEYIFRVKGTNNDGVWGRNEGKLTIIILPPWWKSTIAYIGYSVLFALVLFIAIKFWMQSQNKKNDEKQKIFERKKEKELYEAKISFFTDIAHEIRTPVTLINGPLESIMNQQIEDERVNYNLNIIQRNTNHLLELINQLLDFRKIDSLKFTIIPKKQDIIELINNSISKFDEAIITNEINWSIDYGLRKHLFATVDKEAMAKIVNNLISNAIKYTSTSITLRLDMDENYFTIKISNDGELISVENKDKIFDPFFRVKNSATDISGSGLGLSLVKTLVEAHNGYVYYNTKRNMNNFYVKIPLNEEEIPSVINKEGDCKLKKEKTDRSSNSNVLNDLITRSEYKKTLLIVEDNLDMLDFISNELDQYYIVEKAKDGDEAINILKKTHIDIVITDVMMPNRNGFELCQHIKNDAQMSEIIVILLTAKDDVESQIHGLEIGADAYAKKPFSIRYIVTLIATLVKNKQKAIDNYMEKPFLPMQQPGLNKSDTQFLDKVVEIVNENIADSNFNVERLADLMNLSRSSLHRRIKTTIDSTPTDFIRLIRLQKATTLIQDGEYRINEICYLIGINSLSYFIKIFQRQYGMTPKEYEDILKGKFE